MTWYLRSQTRYVASCQQWLGGTPASRPIGRTAGTVWIAPTHSSSRGPGTRLVTNAAAVSSNDAACDHFSSSSAVRPVVGSTSRGPTPGRGGVETISQPADG